MEGGGGSERERARERARESMAKASVRRSAFRENG